MATDSEALLLQMSADVRSLQKSWDRAYGVTDESSRKIERRAGVLVGNIERQLGGVRLPKSLAREYEKLGQDIGRGLARTSQAAQLALAGVTAYSIKLAADAAEIESAFDVAFNSASASARQFADVLADKVGRDAVELREKMTRLQLVLTGTGVAADMAAQMVQRLTEVGVDAGSLFNTSDAEALQKIVSGLTGESEPLKAFGVVINEAALKAELLRLGFKGTVQEASEATKSIARANLIIQGLAVAQGDAARTADSASNKAKAMRAEFNKAARELGEQLLPAFVAVTGGVTDLLQAFNDLPDGVQIAGLAILGFIAAAGPIGGLIANLSRVIKLAKETRAAVAGIAAAGGGTGSDLAAGAAGGAAARGLGLGARAGLIGGAIGAPLATAGIGAALIASGAQYQKTVRGLGDASEEALQAAINRARAEIEAYDGGPAGKHRVEKMQGDLSKLMFEQLRRQAAADLGGAADTPAGVVGGFTLSGDQLTPAGGGKGKKGPKAPRDVSDERAAQISAQVAAAEADVLRARLDLAVNAADRADLERQIIEKARVIEDERLTGQLAALEDQRGLTPAMRARVQAEIEGLRLKNNEVAELQRQAVEREAADRAVLERLDLSQQDLDHQEELVSIAASMARTASERRQLELRLLELADQRIRAEQEAIIATQGVSEAEKELARRRLRDLDASAPARRALVLDQTAGPAEAFVRANAGAEQLAETMQGSFVQGIDALASGLGDAAVQARSLGDVAKNVFRQIIADFVAAQARRATASFLGGFLKLPGFASGTDSSPQGWARINERGPEGVAFLPKNTKVIPNDVMRALGNLSIGAIRSQGASALNLSIDLTGANGDETIRRIAYQAAFEGATAARTMAVQDVNRQQGRRAKGTLW